MVPKLVNNRIRAAGLQKHCDCGNLSVVRLVHQMRYHIEWLAVNVFFARMMKVELRQLVALVAHNQKVSISRGIVHSDRRVAVVNDSERAASVFEPYGGEFGFLRVLNVDGRLFPANFAGSVLRVQVTPMIGAGWPFVSPMCLPL